MVTFVLSEDDRTVSNWLPGEPRYGFDYAVFTNTKHRTGWKSVNCSTKHTTLCIKGHINKFITLLS